MLLTGRIKRIARVLDSLAPREPSKPQPLSLAAWCCMGSRLEDIEQLEESDQDKARLMLSPPDRSDPIEARIAEVERHGR
jgi:hypothetical protein